MSFNRIRRVATDDSEAQLKKAGGWELAWGSLRSYGGASLLCAIGGAVSCFLFVKLVLGPAFSGEFDLGPWVTLGILLAWIGSSLCGVIYGLLSLYSDLWLKRLTAVALASACSIAFCAILVGLVLAFLTGS